MNFRTLIHHSQFLYLGAEYMKVPNTHTQIFFEVTFPQDTPRK